MKVFLKIAGLVFLVVVLTYLITAWMAWDLNPNNWNKEYRASVAVITGISVTIPIIVSMLKTLIDEWF